MNLRLCGLSWLILFAIASLGQAAPPRKSAPAKSAAEKAPPLPTEAQPEQPTDEAPAAPARPRKLKFKAEPSMVAVIEESGGRKTLAIHFRWQVFQQPSVEVRLIPGEAQEGVGLAPYYFVGEYLKGAVLEKILRCEKRAADVAASETFTKDKTEFKILAERNTLGRPAAMILPGSVAATSRKRPGAVFVHLDRWAVNDRTLCFDLPRDVFQKKGKLFVWFFRGGELLWEEKIDWPGYGKQEPAKAEDRRS